jgi:hypothetical protein
MLKTSFQVAVFLLQVIQSIHFVPLVFILFHYQLNAANDSTASLLTLVMSYAHIAQHVS